MSSVARVTIEQFINWPMHNPLWLTVLGRQQVDQLVDPSGRELVALADQRLVIVNPYPRPRQLFEHGLRCDDLRDHDIMDRPRTEVTSSFVRLTIPFSTRSDTLGHGCSFPP